MAFAIQITDRAQQAIEIPQSSHAEAGKLSQTEYERVLAVLEALEGDDWQQPTYCAEWNVFDMVAHLAGSVTGSTSFAEFRRQNLQNPYLKQFEKPEDGTNKLQVEERASHKPAELIAEFRQNGQIAVDKRQNLSWLVRKIRVPMSDMGLTSFEYLMDVIYPRDQWMHRYDICAATGKRMVVTAEHDGRLIDLVLLDLAKKLKKLPGRRSVLLHLTGALESEYQFGEGNTPDCTVTIDFYDFNLRASGRISVQEARSRTNITGDNTAANWFLTNMEVPY